MWNYLVLNLYSSDLRIFMNIVTNSNSILFDIFTVFFLSILKFFLSLKLLTEELLLLSINNNKKVSKWRKKSQ